MAEPATDPNPQPTAEWNLFSRLLPPPLLNDLDPRAPQAASTAWVVAWLLVFQRLHGNAPLLDAVAEFTLRFHPQTSPDRPRQLSGNTGAYGKARVDLDSRVLYWAADNVYDSLVQAYPPSWRGRRAFLLDGTTTQLAPTLELRRAFPPASNQHGDSHWPILHLLVAHELSSGLAAFPECGPMYGPQARSELSLACAILPRLPERSILLGDRNFGVFAFAWAATQRGHDVLLRLTGPRFGALRKKGRQVAPGTWEVTWHPSVSDRRSHPELSAEAEVKGWLHEVKVSEKLTLWLLTTLEGSGEEVAALYGHRQDVESSYRQMRQARIPTCTRDPLLRLLYVGVALILRNVWVWLHWEALSQPRRGARRFGLGRLTFRGMLAWLQRFAEQHFGVLDEVAAYRPMLT